jgi:LAO/AO transport system kinase
VLRHQRALTDSGELAARRAQQARGWMWAEVQDSLIADLREDAEVRRHLPELEAATSEGRLPAAAAAARLLEIYLKRQ